MSNHFSIYKYLRSPVAFIGNFKLKLSALDKADLMHP